MLRPKSTIGYTQPLEDIALEFISKIKVLRDDKGEMPDNFLDEIYRWGLESVAFLALNTRLGCLNPELSEDSEQITLIRAVSTIFKTSAILDNGIQLWKHLPKSRELDRFIESCEVFKMLATKYVKASLERIKDRPSSSKNEEPTLLELFHARGCDEVTALVMALDMIFAGIDTSSHTVAFAMYRLAKNPQVQEKLYQEILGQLPSKESRMDRKTLEKMPYLKAVIKETLR